MVSREPFNTRSQTVIAMAVTGRPQRAGFPLTYALGPRDLPEPSWVKITQIRAISTERLGRRLGRLPEDEVDRIIEGLIDIVGP